MRRLIELGIGVSLAWSAGQAALSVRPPGVSSALLEAGAPPPQVEGQRAAPPPGAADGGSAQAPSPSLEPATSVPPIGARYDDDAALPAHAATVASYTLRASLDPAAHTLTGDGQIVWKNASRVPQKELFVHLYLNAFKNDRSYFMRVPLGGFRGSSGLSAYGYITVKRFAVREMDGQDLWPSADRTSPGDPEDETDIRVPLPRAVEPGGTITIDVAWEEHLPSLVFRTGFTGSFHMLGQWFPKLARLEPDGRWAHFKLHHLSEFYADFGAYDVTIDTPDSFTVGATGNLESETFAGGRAERRYVQADVHDFAFTAWDRFRELKSTTPDGVALRCLFPEGYERVAAIQLDTARFGLDYMGKAFGRYPYSTLTLIHPPTGAEEAGGMEYPTLVTTGGLWLEPKPIVKSLEIVTIHELGHQWFYGLVATNENAWPFLDEGVNSYAESVTLEARFPKASAFEGAGLSVSMAAAHRIGGVERVRNTPIAQPADAFVSGGDYGALVYSRTATILNTLALVYGEDTVRRAVGRYARRYRFQHPGPEEFIGAFHEVLGPEAAAALRTALFERGTVDYVVENFSSTKETAPAGFFGDPAVPASAAAPSAVASAAAGAAAGAAPGAAAGSAPGTSSPAAAPEGATVWKGNALVRRLGALRFPVDVDFIGEDGAVQRVRWEAHESSVRLPYTGKTKLAAVVIDPERRVLLDDNLGNNARRESRAILGLRLTERMLYGTELGLSAVLP